MNNITLEDFFKLVVSVKENADLSQSLVEEVKGYRSEIKSLKNILALLVITWIVVLAGLIFLLP